MEQGLKFKEMLGSLQIALESIPEHRKGKNTQYTLIDAACWLPRTSVRFWRMLYRIVREKMISSFVSSDSV